MHTHTHAHTKAHTQKHAHTQHTHMYTNLIEFDAAGVIHLLHDSDFMLHILPARTPPQRERERERERETVQMQIGMVRKRREGRRRERGRKGEKHGPGESVSARAKASERESETCSILRVPIRFFLRIFLLKIFKPNCSPVSVCLISFTLPNEPLPSSLMIWYWLMYLAPLSSLRSVTSEVSTSSLAMSLGPPPSCPVFERQSGNGILNPKPRQTQQRKGLQRSQASEPGRCMSATDCLSRSLRCTRRSVNASAADCSAENNPAGRSPAAAQAGTRRQKIHSDACNEDITGSNARSEEADAEFCADTRRAKQYPRCTAASSNRKSRTGSPMP